MTPCIATLPHDAAEMVRMEPLLLVGVIAIIGFFMGNAAKKLRLPSLIGFMVLGVLLGPSLLSLLNEDNLPHLEFITQIALGFVAFGIGAELSVANLRSLGKSIVIIIFAESLGAFIVVTAALYAFTRSWPIALLFGALAPASAPAGTVAVIQEYKAKGPLTRALYAVVGFDDGLAIIIFGIAAAVARLLLLRELGIGDADQSMWAGLLPPLFEIAGSLLLGTLVGFVFSWVMRRLSSGREMLIMTFGTVLTVCGIAAHFHLSLILTNMVVGFILVNTRREAFVHRATAPLQEIMPLIFLLFFTLAGAHLRIGELPKLGFAGILYVLARSVGLIGGSRLGAILGRSNEMIRKYIGLGILSQAGVAIGLSLMISHDFDKLVSRPEVAAAVQEFALNHPDVSAILYNPVVIATALITTITATCIVFEVVGPILTKIALSKAGEIGKA